MHFGAVQELIFEDILRRIDAVHDPPNGFTVLVLVGVFALSCHDLALRPRFVIGRSGEHANAFLHERVHRRYAIHQRAVDHPDRIPTHRFLISPALAVPTYSKRERVEVRIP